MNKILTVRLPDEQLLELETVSQFDGVAIAEEIREAISLLLESRRSDPEFRDRVSSSFERARKLLGEHPGTDEIVSVLRDPLSDADGDNDLRFSQLRADDVASLLGISRRVLLKRAADGELFAVPKGDTVVFPKWQFDENYHLRPGVDKLVTTFQDLLGGAYEPSKLESWIASPSPLFDGTIPADLIQAGKTEDVIGAAADYANSLVG